MSVTIKPMTESAFQRQVMALGKLFGWRACHFLPGMNRRGQWRTAVQGQGNGFPDVVLVRDRVSWVELKTDTGRLTPEQEDWAACLSAAGQEVYLWRPRDWPTIEATLR